MAIESKYFTMGPMVVSNVGDPTKYISVQSSSLSPNLAMIVGAGSGSLFNKQMYVAGSAPTLSFTSNMIRYVLETLCESGVGTLATGKNLSVWVGMTKYAVARETNGTKIAIGTGSNLACAIPQAITVSNNGMASISVTVIPLGTSSTAPIDITASAALPTGELGSTGVFPGDMQEMWTLGEVKIEDAVVAGVSSVTINFGMNYEVMASGYAWPINAHVLSQTPSISISTTDKSVLMYTGETYGFKAKTANKTVSVTLNSVTSSGERTSTAIVVAVPAGFYTVNDLSLQNGSSGSVQLTVTPLYDNSGGILDLTFPT